VRKTKISPSAISRMSGRPMRNPASHCGGSLEIDWKGSTELASKNPKNPTKRTSHDTTTSGDRTQKV